MAQGPVLDRVVAYSRSPAVGTRDQSSKGSSLCATSSTNQTRGGIFGDVHVNARPAIHQPEEVKKLKITITLPGLHLWKWAALPLVAFALMLTWGHATAAPPPNDDIADAIPILELPFIHQVDTTDATVEGTDPFKSCKGSPKSGDYGHSVWYRYIPTDDTTLKLTTGGSDYDTIIAVFKSEGLLEVGCNDDHKADGDFIQSYLKVDVLRGTEYFIKVSSWRGTDGGNLRLIVQEQDWPDFAFFDIAAFGDTGACNTALKATKCRFSPGTTFTVEVYLTKLPASLIKNYELIQVWLQHSTGLTAEDGTSIWHWPDLGVVDFDGVFKNTVVSQAFGDPSVFTGLIYSVDFTCPDKKTKETITASNGHGAITAGNFILDFDENVYHDQVFGPTLIINCDNYYPWDVHGPGQSADLDGIVDLPNDILGVILHFCPNALQPCSKANLP